jgi:hypothetical protein
VLYGQPGRSKGRVCMKPPVRCCCELGEGCGLGNWRGNWAVLFLSWERELCIIVLVQLHDEVGLWLMP